MTHWSYDQPLSGGHRKSLSMSEIRLSSRPSSSTTIGQNRESRNRLNNKDFDLHPTRLPSSFLTIRPQPKSMSPTHIPHRLGLETFSLVKSPTGLVSRPHSGVLRVSGGDSVPNDGSISSW